MHSSRCISRTSARCEVMMDWRIGTSSGQRGKFKAFSAIWIAPS